MHISSIATVTYRFLSNVVECLIASVNHLALNLVRPATIVSQAAHASADVALCHRDGLAIVQRLDCSKGLKIGLEQVGELEKVLGAVAGSDLAPLALKGSSRGLHGDVDIFLGSLVHGGDDALVRRVDDLKGLAVNAFDEFVVDETRSVEMRLAGARLALVVFIRRPDYQKWTRGKTRECELCEKVWQMFLRGREM